VTKLRMSWPNRITLGRILLIVPFIVAMLRVNDPQYHGLARYAALGLFVTMSFSDVLDGYLARRNHDITSLGKFLDPLADKLLIICACLLLTWTKTAVPGIKLPDIVVVFILGKDIYITLGFIVIYMVTGNMHIVPAKIGKLSTTLQLAMVLAMLTFPDAASAWPGFIHFIKFLWWSVIVVAMLAVVIYTRNGTRYLNEYEQKQVN
jgi:CDP-diacylglycerol--glycerol-3-phosphate 3-phosphatidyltransferase